MTSEQQPLPESTDRNAAITLVAGLLALVAVCIAIMPVPFTGYICFPAAAVLTVAAAIHGLRALRRFSALTGTEKGMIVAGMAASAAGMGIAACSAVVVVALGLRLAEALRQLAR